MAANCTVSIAGHGKKAVRATRVVHGMSVVAYASEGQSRARKTFYSSKRTSGSFELTLTFATHAGYTAFNEWLERYARQSANPRAVPAPVRVIIPSRNFDKVGALSGGVTYGDEIDATSYQITLSFVGSRDPLDLGVKTNLSQFQMPKSKDLALPYLYPGGKQLGGKERGWDAEFERILNTPGEGQPPTPAPPPTRQPGHWGIV